MAETIVCYLIDKVIPFLTEVVKLSRGVDKEVSEIKRELESIQAFLEDADRKAEDDGDVTEGVKAWVKDLRDVAFRIEDVVDEYTYHMTVQRPKRKFGDIFKRKPHHQIAAQIEEIKDTLQRIAARRERYGFIASQQTSTTARKWPDPRKASLFLKETEVIGLDSPRDKLIEDLKSQSPPRLVASIFGGGGLGKTTLAKQVYDRIKGDFDCHAWIAVSKSDKVEDLLRNLMEKFGEGGQQVTTPNAINTMKEEALITHLRKYLHKKRYLVIFDDVWNDEFWGGIEHALLDDESHGRILITTRNLVVAKKCQTSSQVVMHKMDPMRFEMAMELFYKKSFQFDNGGGCPSELENLSAKIVSRCKGIPLAIVVAAGILSTKEKTVYQWQKFLDSLGSEVLNHYGVGRILSLSYNNLPYNLRCCYLYFGMFPKGYSIRCGRLIRQWIAGGFVIDERDKTLEDVAKEYLTELVDRSLVEISKVDGEGKARTCRVHDFLHDVISQKMEDLSSCQVFSGDELSNFSTVARRLSIIGSSNNIPSTIDVSRLRGFSISSQDEMLNSTVSKFAASFKLLKELDFENFPHLNHLPEDIGNLVLLRYLSVRGTRVKNLPKSVEKLINLETLDLKRSSIYEIPFEINNLLKLRHLFGNCLSMKGNPMKNLRGMKVEGIGSLKSLQKLYYIEANNAEFDMCKELGPLTQLRTLGITQLRSEDGRSLCGCIEKMERLESLFVSSTSEEDIIDLESMTRPPKFLRRLCLAGPLRKLPDWITKLQYLTKISIQCSKLGDGQLKVLGILPELVELHIVHEAFVGQQLHFEEGGFPKLKALELSNLKGLNSLIIKGGALPVLEKLCMDRVELQEMRIQHSRNLQILMFNMRLSISVEHGEGHMIYGWKEV